MQGRNVLGGNGIEVHKHLYPTFSPQQKINPSRYYYYYNSIITLISSFNTSQKNIIFQKFSYENE
jgi:hypothetical protein